MLFLEHLDKYNYSIGQGSRSGYVALVSRYLITYLTKRPPLIRSIGSNLYKSRKKLLYTVLTGGYDQLNEIPPSLSRSKKWDFVCVTDNPSLSSDTWKIKLVGNEDGLDPILLSRYYKLKNHLIDSDYDISVYLDANIRIRGDLDSFLSHALAPDRALGLLYHPFHSSLEQEVELCTRTCRGDPKLLEQQYHFYTDQEKFSDSFPHINARLLIRRPGDRQIESLMETWFNQLLDWSKRDQMSFNYSLAQHPDVLPCYIPYWLFRVHFKKLDHI
ncbi:MAG: DUF616 domain-containing protein [Desulfofustis sp.]|nr:DUF616 domain-containing protein [Desulfofustis sp.]NNK57390.1 DUF616 domain-containing protein [Desulfofustis sp.]